MFHFYFHCFFIVIFHVFLQVIPIKKWSKMSTPSFFHTLHPFFSTCSVTITVYRRLSSPISPCHWVLQLPVLTLIPVSPMKSKINCPFLFTVSCINPICPVRSPKAIYAFCPALSFTLINASKVSCCLHNSSGFLLPYTYVTITHHSAPCS